VVVAQRGVGRRRKGKSLARVPHKRVKGLRCFQEVYERICAGYPMPEIARYVQEEEGESTDIPRATLAEDLRLFMHAEVVPADLIAPRLPHLVVKAQREFNDRLEDLRRLERAYEVLLYRLDLAHGMERRTGVIDPNVDRHAKSLIDLVARMHEIKMDLGLTGSRDLGTLTVSAERLQEIKDRYGEGAARAFADPVQRAQVLGLLKRIMRLAGRTDLDTVDGLCAPTPVAVAAEDDHGEPVEAEIDLLAEQDDGDWQ